jgi:predicted transcriptional regulator
MKTLTAKEEELMGFFWEKGPLFVKQLLDFYDDPKPHFNTLSTIVRGLEDKGYLTHTAFGNTYQYAALVSEEDFRKSTLRNVVSKYFDNSFLGAVSTLVREESISLEDLKKLVAEVEAGQTSQPKNDRKS